MRSANVENKLRRDSLYGRLAACAARAAGKPKMVQCHVHRANKVSTAEAGI